ncbi:hypothetical protein ElyMa_005486100, partial [Elysia marginata]
MIFCLRFLLIRGARLESVETVRVATKITDVFEITATLSTSTGTEPTPSASTGTKPTPSASTGTEPTPSASTGTEPTPSTSTGTKPTPPTYIETSTEATPST